VTRSALIAWRSAIIASTVGSSARLVALVLSTHMDRDGGSCFPSLTTLARETGLSRRTVCNALDELEHAGLVERARTGRGRPTRYRATSATTALAGAAGSAADDTQLVQLLHLTSATAAPEDVQEDAQESVHKTYKPKRRANARQTRKGARAAGAHPDSNYLDGDGAP
jgi:predicted ArsR family transcriptional regulator